MLHTAIAIPVAKWAFSQVLKASQQAASASGARVASVERTLTIENRTRHDYSAAIAIGAQQYAYSMGWFNIRSGHTFAMPFDIPTSGLEIILYYENDVDMKANGPATMYILRPSAFTIENARRRDAHLTGGNGKLEVVSGTPWQWLSERDFAYIIEPPD